MYVPRFGVQVTCFVPALSGRSAAPELSPKLLIYDEIPGLLLWFPTSFLVGLHQGAMQQPSLAISWSTWQLDHLVTRFYDCCCHWLKELRAVIIHNHVMVQCCFKKHSLLFGISWAYRPYVYNCIDYNIVKLCEILL